MDLSNVRIREHFGLLTNDTQTDKFSFLVSPPKSRRSVEKHDYVLVDHPLLGEACPILAVIKEITSYEEVTGSTIGDRVGRMLATTEILGYIDLRKQTRPLQRLLAPPNPGSRVYVPLTSFLEDTLNRNSSGEVFTLPLMLGKLEGAATEDEQTQNQINCFLDAQELTTKHTLIAAMAGTGKTCIAKKLIRELSSKAGIPAVVVDPAGEYSNIEAANVQVVIFAAKPNVAKKGTQVRTAQIKSLPDKSEDEVLSQAVKSGQIVVLNGQGLTLKDSRVFYSNCFEALLKNRMEQNIPPFFLVAEEVENLNGEAFDQVLTEGRKMGIAICLVSIHPTELGGRILSQISNQIVGKITDKNDLEYLKYGANANADMLASLGVDEWIVNGVNRPRPLKVHIPK